MTTVLNLFQGKLLPSLHNALERHVPAGLTAYSPPRVSPSPLEYARYLLLAGVVVAVFYCLMKSSNLMARENQGAGGFELIDDQAQEEAPVVDGLAVLSLSNEAAPAAVRAAAADGPALDEEARLRAGSDEVLAPGGDAMQEEGFDWLAGLTPRSKTRVPTPW